MKTIKLSKVSINLDIGDELRVKDIIKIEQLLKDGVIPNGESQESSENDLVRLRKVVLAFAIGDDIEDTIDCLSLPDFTKLTSDVMALLSGTKEQKKTKK